MTKPGVPEPIKIEERPEDRDKKGKFTKGNKISRDTIPIRVIGVSNVAIRSHRQRILDHIPEILDQLIHEAKVNNDKQIGMWLTDKVLPNTKPATFTPSEVVGNVNTLTELKEQAATTIKATLEGKLSIEDGTQIMGMYQGQKTLIEASEIEPLAQEIAKRMKR